MGGRTLPSTDVRAALDFVRLLARAFLGLFTAGTLIDCAGMMAYLSILTVPVLIPLLWLIARGANRWFKGWWIFLACGCGWRFGQFIGCYYLGSHSCEPMVPIPALTALVVAVVFVATTTRNHLLTEMSPANRDYGW